MDLKLELVAVPVSDVDRAKAFYTDQAGFHADHDFTVSDEVRFVQLTPPGSACSIAIGKGLTDAAPGSVQGLQLVADREVVVGVEAGLIGIERLRPVHVRHRNGDQLELHVHRCSSSASLRTPSG